jgi:hypothetical protein
MARVTQRDATPMDEALALSQQQGAALLEDDLDSEEVEDSVEEEEDYGLPESPPYTFDDNEADPDIEDLNNPDVSNFGEPPLIGGRSSTTDMYGETAESFGRMSSPKLYAQAGQFPTAVQYRVWRWENGIPVGLGAIDSEATEDDFVRQFYDAMPKSGDGRFQFKCRPVDIRGKELGKEFALNISEHHSEVRRVRKERERDKEERMGHGDPIVISQGGNDSGGIYAEEMGRMFEQAVETAERRTELLQETLEQEREHLREEEKSRYQERISVAERSTDVVQKMTDRLMETDRARSQEQLATQNSQSDMLLKTLTTVFSQQQESARQQADRLREHDAVRLSQDREFFDRQRQETETKRRQDKEEYEQRMVREREEAKFKTAQSKTEAEMKVQQERDRLDLEAKRIEEQRKFELASLRVDAERRQQESDARRQAERDEIQRREEALRAEATRKEGELERRREQEKNELQMRLEREKLEADRQRDLAREERERWRVELEEKRRTEREDWERKQAQAKEDSERRERSDRERMERERLEYQLRIDRDKQEAERREGLRREELQREADRRRDELAMAQKQLEMSAQKDREHSERMMEMARIERESSREAQLQREKQEREAREATERDRQRQHDMSLREMEMNKERDREHQERMLQLSKIQNSGGISGLVDSLGMETPEILGRIFGGGEGEGSWSDAIPKVLGSIAELGAAAMKAKGDHPQIQQRGRRQLPANARVIQTPQGPQVVLPGAVTGIPGTGATTDLPAQGSVPPEFRGVAFTEEPKEEAEETPAPTPEPEPVEIDLMARAKAAGMSLGDQKRARKALRVLVSSLDGAEIDSWLGLITEAITSEVGIYYYIKAVTVEAALGEAAPGEDELHTRIVTALKESQLIPEDVPYTEEDFTALEVK